MNKPHVIINCAMSADGKIATPSGKQLRISNKEDLKRMYNLRNNCDAVLVGVKTILSDDPKLTVKEEYVTNPKNPIRVILDTQGRTRRDAHAADSAAKTIIITNGGFDRNYGDNVEVIQCDIDSEGFIDIGKMLEILYSQGIKKLMVEGGSTVIWNFLKNGFADDMYIFIGPIIIGGKYTPSMADGDGISNENDVINLGIVDVSKLDNGILVHYRLIK